jgi:hypothetical protein
MNATVDIDVDEILTARNVATCENSHSLCVLRCSGRAERDRGARVNDKVLGGVDVQVQVQVKVNVVCALALAIVSVGCGQPARRTLMLTSDAAEYPGVIHDPHTLPHDFVVRQTITIHAKKPDGTPVEGEFDAVLQKQGDTLLIVGFGPMNVKAFTVKHQANQIEFVQFMGPPLPFSPRNMIVDVHRVFFKRLPVPPDASASFTGARTGELDGEHVEETWQDGQLSATVFTRPDNALLHGAVRIELGPGCSAAACEPTSATLHNEWFGYTLGIANEGYEKL